MFSLKKDLKNTDTNQNKCTFEGVEFLTIREEIEHPQAMTFP